MNRTFALPPSLDEIDAIARKAIEDLPDAFRAHLNGVRLVVEDFPDEATLAGLHEVSIIHGKGTGVLRMGIQRHLKGHMDVKNFRLGVYGEGEDGVTVVTLK